MNDLFSLLDTFSVKVYPSGYDGEKSPPPYIRASLVPSGPPLNAVSTTGVLMLELFTAWGNGPAEGFRIADQLDNLFQRTTVGTTQFFESSVDRQQRDPDDQTLARMIYTIPFSHFGVLN